jgi:hypothetical protein
VQDSRLGTLDAGVGTVLTRSGGDAVIGGSIAAETSASRAEEDSNLHPVIPDQTSCGALRSSDDLRIGTAADTLGGAMETTRACRTQW